MKSPLVSSNAAAQGQHQGPAQYQGPAQQAMANEPPRVFVPNFYWPENNDGILRLVLPPPDYQSIALSNPYAASEASPNESQLDAQQAGFNPGPIIKEVPLSAYRLNGVIEDPATPGIPAQNVGLGASIPESLNPVEDDDFFGLPQDAELQHLIPKGLNVSLKSGPELKPTLTPCESVYSSRAVSFASSESLETGGMAFTATDLIDHDGMDVDGDMEMDIDPMMRVARSIDKHHKKLFGDGGWLESPQASANAVRKSTGFKALGKKFKQQLAEITEDVARDSQPLNATTPVSLGPVDQAKLYSELELMICNTANAYLVQQYYDGRVSTQSINKVNHSWAAKNRPQVTEFHFDQATQRELIEANRRSLEFAGGCSTNPVQLNANLRNWKVIAQEMSVRTFCLPDSAIRKHLHDLVHILDMLNAPVATLQALLDLRAQIHQKMSETIRPRSKLSFL